MSLIQNLIQRNVIRSPGLVKAFLEVKRSDFLPAEERSKAEIDAPVAIGFGQTNSQPTTVAMMLEWLDPQEGECILDAGCGSGWTTALLASAVGIRGRVFGVELIAALAAVAERNVSKYNFIGRGIVRILAGDAYSGLKEYALYDKILVSAAALEVPAELLLELKNGGRIVLPVGPRCGPQSILIIDKDMAGKITKRTMPGFVFVPLV